MRLLLALPLLLFSTAAWAGQRAVYNGKDGKQIMIEIGDDGSARVTADKPDQYGLLRDGHFYIVGKENGVWKTARIEDLAAAIDQVMPPIFKDLFNAATTKKPARPGLRIVAQGNRTIAGHEGQVYAVYGIDDAKPNEPRVFVLSKEPALQPIGKAMEEFMLSSVVLFAPLIGNAAGEMAADMRTISSYGVPLDVPDEATLVSLQTIDIPATEFALPSQPETVAQLVAEMKTSGMGAAAQ